MNIEEQEEYRLRNREDPTSRKAQAIRISLWDRKSAGRKGPKGKDSHKAHKQWARHPHKITA